MTSSCHNPGKYRLPGVNYPRCWLPNGETTPKGYFERLVILDFNYSESQIYSTRIVEITGRVLAVQWIAWLGQSHYSFVVIPRVNMGVLPRTGAKRKNTRALALRHEL